LGRLVRLNGGSQLQADANAAMAVFLTHIAAATATLTWIGWEILKTGRFTVIGMVTGSIAGLAAITPASGYVGPLYAVMIGAVAAIIAQEAVGLIKSKLRITTHWMCLRFTASPGCLVR
jgi:Amt family ammonium transporter